MLASLQQREHSGSMLLLRAFSRRPNDLQIYFVLATFSLQQLWPCLFAYLTHQSYGQTCKGSSK